ncbi:hypothetical protein [Dactylosporangium sp. NPDC000521]|uniref:hypothetical protein n=1 Tax=Dactylosporangium sp. NPDC000521 TaxID=3363975 RepID=UPI00368A80DC
MRGRSASGEVELDGEVWLPVRGVQYRSGGTEVGTEVGAVKVFVRAAKLRVAP